MLKATVARMKQGHRTIVYPKNEPLLPDRFRGCPKIDSSKCKLDCKLCLNECPTKSLNICGNEIEVDLGKCIFCGDCVNMCPTGAISFPANYKMSVRNRNELLLKNHELNLATSLNKKMLPLFGRSLKLRQVSAGGCNACEADINVLGTIVFDIGRFGINFVASPRHADGIVVTGPVTQNMKLALQKTYNAIPTPKIVIAIGACAISGGLFCDNPEVCNGLDNILPIDLYIPGCPPHPITILDGFLRLLDRL